MEQKISEKLLLQTLEELKEISKLDYLLYSAEGDLVAATTEEDCGGPVEMFVASMADSQVVQGWLYFRIELNGRTEYVMVCGRDNKSESIYVIARMALSQIRNMIISAQEPENKIHILRQMITGDLTGEKLEEKCHQLQLKPGRFVLYAIQYKNDEDEILQEIVKNLFANTYHDYVVEINSNRCVLIKDITDIPNENYEQYARMIVDNIQSEVMMNVWIGYGEVLDGYAGLNLAYQNACMALKVGKVFQSGVRVFSFQNLGIGRLIYQLPVDICQMFLKEVLGENMNVEFDEETITTINELFDNNLNISETARKLYIHRNTLVYRLERIEKRLGLDIRSFEDAMLFKIAMMVRLHLNELVKQTDK